MWTIYTGQDGQAAAETHGPVAICGHDPRQAGLPGGQGPKTVCVSFNLQMSPTEPPRAPKP